MKIEHFLIAEELGDENCPKAEKSLQILLPRHPSEVIRMMYGLHSNAYKHS